MASSLSNVLRRSTDAGERIDHMDFFTLLKIMVRRWFVVIPVLALTAVLGVVFIGEPQVLYASGGSELLISQSANSDDAAPSVGATTPAISSSAAGGILISALQSQSFRRSFADRGLASDFSIGADLTVTVLTVTIGANSRAVAVATGEALVVEAPGVLAAAVGPTQAAGLQVTSISPFGEDDVIRFAGQQTLTLTLVVLPTATSASPFPPNLTTLRTLSDLSRRPEVVAAVREVAPTATYNVGSEARDTAPIVNISIQAENPGEIEPAYRRLVEALNGEIRSLQAAAGGGADIDQTILVTLTPPSGIQQTSSSIVRSAAGFALLGFAAACGLAILVDSLILRRRARRDPSPMDDVT